VAVRIFNHYVPVRVLLLAVVDIALLVLAAVVGGVLRFGGDMAALLTDYPHFGKQCVVFGAVMFLSMFAVGLYQGRISLRLLAFASRVIVAFIMGAVTLAALYYLIDSPRLGRGMLLPSLVVGLMFVTASRLVFRHTVGDEFFRRRVAVLGTGRRAAQLLDLPNDGETAGFSIVAFIPSNGGESEIGGNHWVTRPARLLDFMREHQCDEIVVAVDDRRSNLPMHDLLECRLHGYLILDVAAFMERESGRVRLDMLYPSWFIFSDHSGRDFLRRAVRRTFDILASLLLLAVSLPMMLVAVLAIWVESGFRGPIFYRQVRVGREGKLFRLIKFRTMVSDAEGLNGAQWCGDNDPRITRVGRLLRKCRFDEVPQVINVLKGEMAFVGPRPERPEFVAPLCEKIPYFRERLMVKPGITGWAQLRYPYGANEDDAREKLQYDLFYVKNQSLLFDIAILLQTAEVVLWRKGGR
jgi:sugar transferase (PEP-CTERM system associated)